MDGLFGGWYGVMGHAICVYLRAPKNGAEDFGGVGLGDPGLRSLSPEILSAAVKAPLNRRRSGLTLSLKD